MKHSPKPMKHSPKQSATDRPALGSIRADELAPSRVFCGRMGLGRKAWTELLKKGFPSVLVGKQRFVLGSAALEWFGKQAESEAQQQ